MAENRQKTIDPGDIWVYIQECHPRGLIAQSGLFCALLSFPRINQIGASAQVVDIAVRSAVSWHPEM